MSKIFSAPLANSTSNVSSLDEIRRGFGFEFRSMTGNILVKPKFDKTLAETLGHFISRLLVPYNAICIKLSWDVWGSACLPIWVTC